MKLKEVIASLSIKATALTVVCVSLFLLAVPASADTIFTGAGCPGLGFVAGLVSREPDVDVENICDFLNQGGGLSGPGFGLGQGGWPSGREEACIEAGGFWDGHRCTMADPKPNPRPCPTCAPIPPTATILLPSSPTSLYGLPVTYKGQRILVLVKRSYVNTNTKNKLVPILLGKGREPSNLKSKGPINK